jgi:alpha-L-rhamnosidase
MLRMELLSQAGRGQQVLDESIAYLLYMADRTGTLWENMEAEASCNHGFASHIVHTLYRDVLGLYSVDPLSKTVHVRLGDLRLDWCAGSLLTPDGPIELRWDKQADRISYRLKSPPGYKVTMENLTGKPIEEGGAHPAQK